jgi:hypothetical protein
VCEEIEGKKNGNELQEKCESTERFLFTGKRKSVKITSTHDLEAYVLSDKE